MLRSAERARSAAYTANGPLSGCEPLLRGSQPKPQKSLVADGAAPLAARSVALAPPALLRLSRSGSGISWSAAGGNQPPISREPAGWRRLRHDRRRRGTLKCRSLESVRVAGSHMTVLAPGSQHRRLIGGIQHNHYWASTGELSSLLGPVHFSAVFAIMCTMRRNRDVFTL